MGLVNTIHIFISWNIGNQIIAPCMADMHFNHFVYDFMLLKSVILICAFISFCSSFFDFILEKCPQTLIRCRIMQCLSEWNVMSHNRLGHVEMWPRLRVSSDKLGELGIPLGSLWYKASGSFNTPRGSWSVSDLGLHFWPFYLDFTAIMQSPS